MNELNDERGSLRYLLALRQHWRLMALLVVVAVAAAIVYSSTAEKRYEAEADILVTPLSSNDVTFAGIPLIRESGQSRAVLTVARLLETPAVANGVKRRLATDRDRDDLLNSVEVVPQEQSTIVTVVGKAPTPRGAARLANTFARVLIDQRTAAFQRHLEASVKRMRDQMAALPPAQRTSTEALALQQRIDSQAALLGLGDPTVQLASVAAPPSGPVWPKRTLSIFVALIAALLLGAGLAVGLELLNPRIRSEEALTSEHRLPILTRVPRLSKKAL